MCSNPVLVLLACWYKWMGSLHSTEKSSRFWQICQKKMHHLKLELRIWVNIAYPLSSLTHDSTKANGRLKPKMVSHILGLELEMNWYGPILLCNRLSKPLQSRLILLHTPFQTHFKMNRNGPTVRYLISFQIQMAPYIKLATITKCHCIIKFNF